jgi:hypothetical protein
MIGARVTLVAVAFDAKEPNALARFWAHALRWEVRVTDGVGVELVPTDPTSFRVVLRSVVEEKTIQNRIHFDLTTTSIDDKNHTVAGLLAVGARQIDIGQDPNETHVVLADPEGNEFCIIPSDNRFLASCPRLGAVNCDGTHALGQFWSEALGWPLVWDEGEETAIQEPGGTGPKITWSGPPLMPSSGKDRLHFHVTPSPGATMKVAQDHLVALGATRTNIVGHACLNSIALADVDGNEFCLVE